jgi:hypothetical protein
MSYEADERLAYAAWRTEQVGIIDVMPTGLYRAIADYGTARANLAIKARHGGIGETGQAQEEMTAAWRAVQEEYTLAIRATKGELCPS